ncbi:hypothetical protein LIER_09757 [Lithospermum erythrorhizon]|uniref:Uncharacterized protein n=1 Tax=Lithospermum erythrorhizon TaxID=34254 RepID=A0AAV3PH08_LITER
MLGKEEKLKRNDLRKDFPMKSVDGEPAASKSKRTSTSSSQPTTASSKSKKKKTGASSAQPAKSIREEADLY